MKHFRAFCAGCQKNSRDILGPDIVFACSSTELALKACVLIQQRGPHFFLQEVRDAADSSCCCLKTLSWPRGYVVRSSSFIHVPLQTSTLLFIGLAASVRSSRKPSPASDIAHSCTRQTVYVPARVSVPDHGSSPAHWPRTVSSRLGPSLL